MNHYDDAIRIEGLQKQYGKTHALRGVNLEVKRAEIFGFLGPNGAGKTTTIRCLLDLIKPNSGRLEVLGLDPQAYPVETRKRIGYLPGELNLESNLTVMGQLRYFDDLRGKKTDWKFVSQLAERLQLELKTPIKNLSKGNKQKVGVVQALMGKPELLLLDEPTSGLDPLIQHEVLNLVREARRNGATVFFSSHIINEVEVLADRVGIIRKGVMVEIAEPQTLESMEMRRVTVRFKNDIDPIALAQVEGVSILSRRNGQELTLQVEGDMENLVKALAGFPLRDLQVEHHSLEETFLKFYKNNDQGE